MATVPGPELMTADDGRTEPKTVKPATAIVEAIPPTSIRLESVIGVVGVVTPGLSDGISPD